MPDARRARARVYYRGRDISRFVTDFSYTDNYDQTDDISLTLADRDGSWLKDLFPKTGEILRANIEVLDWQRQGDNRLIFLGEFEVDDVGYSDVFTVGAVAVPITSDARSEKKNRAWRKISLSGIGGDIAGSIGLALVYETDIDPFYDTADQNDKSDLEFLEELCKADGLRMKITAGQLIIFEECKYEQKPEVATIIRGRANIIGDPQFRRNSKAVYKDCEVSYFDPKTDRTYTGYFAAPNVGDVGHTLRLRESFNSESDDMNLDRKAKARLRENILYEWSCGANLVGDLIYFSGVNLVYEGWGEFDGKYHVASCTHSIGGGGYSISLDQHRCLEGY